MILTHISFGITIIPLRILHLTPFHLQFFISRVREYVSQALSEAKKIGKPFVIEEFGLARETASYDAASPTTSRDTLFHLLCRHLPSRVTFLPALAHSQAYTTTIQYTDSQLTYRMIAEHEHDGASGLSFWAWGGEGIPREPGGVWRAGDALVGDPPHEPQVRSSCTSETLGCVTFAVCTL